ncbi:5-formyltetrahydrofolate cyclo-ligase [Shewanella pealeana]|uniref:5-formyltetrahydrofolate cyclo-ligase n=1 Tax=Shewanella pealeana (strain ATCC 700345 / ANG-SQ1) TaxID=398579 RepID=A8H7T9_SHEPA|nr:5-formyltetrahydrofolate cyclo-ligase [Shewanella pealeana]ABV88626.1 5-formyltetrahydrofolate cyclo-ligase [Shewanella pealeana ATCC 700345]
MPSQLPSQFSSTANIQSTRKALRLQIRQARRSLSDEQQLACSQLAAKHTLEALISRKVKCVALYLSNDGELDTQPLIDGLWQNGVDVYLPRLHPFSAGNLLFLRYDKGTQLLKNHLGIWEPKLDITQMILTHQLDVVITPLVAFDLQGNRMGMGGGYYDRSLSNWQQQHRPLPIGYAHDCQQVEALPCEHWDVPLPFIFTPSHCYSFEQ